MLILISDAFDKSLPEKLERFGEVTTDTSRVGEADVILVRSKTTCTREYIDSAKNLKLIIRGGVGIDNIDKDYAESKGIKVHNTPKASSIAVAELAFALMLEVPNHVIEAHNGMKEGQWLKKQIKRTELYGKTLCLVGLGNIGQEVASRAVAFGMNVVAYDRKKRDIPNVEMKQTLEDAVADADYISLHLPLTDETKSIFSRNVISMCRKRPVVINTGRGSCVDADAMVKALQEGSISWYATDVWPSDPPADDYPILHCDRVTLTPHIGASSKENLGRIGEEVVSIIDSVVEGGVL
jgi:D-3-phosphoglycerate dehydrogenase